MHDIKLKVESNIVSQANDMDEEFRGLKRTARAYSGSRWNESETVWLCMSCWDRPEPSHVATVQSHPGHSGQDRNISCPVFRFHFTGHWLLPALDCLVSIILGIRLKLGDLEPSICPEMLECLQQEKRLSTWLAVRMELCQFSYLDHSFQVGLIWHLDRITNRIWRQKV